MWIMDKILRLVCDKVQRRKSSKKDIERRVWQIYDMSTAEELDYFRYPHP